jgi:hypothetical protein
MVRSRDLLTPGLGIIAALFLVVAILDRPAPLPPSAAHYAVAAPAAGTAASAPRPAAPPITFAIDTLEADGTQHPIGDVLPIGARTPITIHGWAVDRRTVAPARAMVLSLDGGPSVPVKDYGLARPDVGAAIGATATNSGFAAAVPLTGLRPGKHIVRLSLIGADGARFELPEPVPFVLVQEPAKGPS